MKFLRSFLVFTIALFLTHCHSDGPTVVTAQGGPVCTVTPTSTGAVVKCVGQDPITITNGSNGSNGNDGIGAGVKVTTASAEECPAGGIELVTYRDKNNNGIQDEGDPTTSSSLICNGTKGASGASGNGFQVTQTTATSEQCAHGGVVYTTEKTDSNGVVIVGTAKQAVICNGETGMKGDTGAPAPFSPLYPIQPCGAASSAWKEVLLCLNNGQVLSDFSLNLAGQDTRLAFLPPGTYQDTDESGCIFNVSTASDGVSTVVSWGAGSNAYSTWKADSVKCENHP